MLPADWSEASPMARVKSLFRQFRCWIRHEIVADDPWDEATLFPEPGENLEHPLTQVTTDTQPESVAAISVTAADPSSSHS